MVSQQVSKPKTTEATIVSLLKRYGMVSQLLREMIIDRSISAIALSAEESLRAWQQFYQQQQLDSDADLHTWMTDRGLSSSELEYLLTRNIRLDRFIQATWGHKVESYFLHHKAQLDRVIYSLIRVKELDLARELFFRIQEDEQSFGELASQYSQGSEAETGGVIGPVEFSVPHPALATLLRTSQPGQLLPPTPVADWVVIVRLERLLPAQLDDAMRQRLLKVLFEEWLQKEITTAAEAETFI